MNNLNKLIKKKIFNEKYKNLIENFFSLSILRGYNALILLLAFPYLTRILGPEKYGLINFARTFIIYFLIFTEFGFNWSATRLVSINRSNTEEVNKILTSITILKVLFSLVCFVTLNIIVLTVEDFSREFLIYIFSFGIVIHNVLVPIFFFQGLEKMKLIAVIEISAKTIYILCILIFVNQTSDYIILAFIDFITYISIGIISQIFLFKTFHIRYTRVSKKDLLFQIKNSKSIFFSRVAINIYTVSNIFIFGLYTNTHKVGLFYAAFQIIIAFKLILNIISQATFPHISKLVNESLLEAKKFIKRILILMFIIGSISSISLFIFADWILNIMTGPQYQDAIILLKLMSPIPFLMAISQVFIFQTLVTFDFQKSVSKIFMNAAFINITLSVILIPLFQEIGLIFVLIVSEVFVTVVSTYLVKKKQLLKS